MALGVYPFRCLDCGVRSWVNVWLFSRQRYARCPRCFYLRVEPFDHTRYRGGLWAKLKLSIGARCYRCEACNFKFLSFKYPDRPAVASPSKGTPLGAAQSSDGHA